MVLPTSLCPPPTEKLQLMAEYHLNHFESAHAAFTQGHSLDGSDNTFQTWIKRCEEMMGSKHDWYQTESQMSAVLKFPSGEDFSLNMNLLHPIVPQHSTFKVLSTKKRPSVNLSLTKCSLYQYPSSSHSSRNWDKVVGDISEEEKKEKLEGDAALNNLFQQIYCDGTDEVKRAMNKSFMESGGTVLSTNWTDVGKRTVEMSPPDDVEFKKY
ncbi:unnamed protein product [Coregonus sp. 'balchen']|nr:unnamed protein product [Coregonus sp. 'balchen']